MKKAITLSFLLLANIVVLVHVAAWHHHHHQNKSAFCFPAANCENNDYGKIEECQLNEAYTSPGSYKLVAGPSLDHGIQHPALFLAGSAGSPACIKNPAFRSEAYLLPCYTGYTSDSFGLRSPPAFI